LLEKAFLLTYNKPMEYYLTTDDLEKCFQFAVEYHLDDTKLASNRTTGQYRGLGGIIDSFFIGKTIEIGVAKMIQGINNKESILDFGIHAINRDNISDPDIIKIKENGIERNPKLFVEIKNVSSGDRWIGLTTEQYETLLRNRIVGNVPDKIIIGYGSLMTRNEGSGDLLGSYLKTKTGMTLFEKFSDINNLYVKLQYIITAKDLKNKGVEFKQGSYLYETEIFQEATGRDANQITSGRGSASLQRIRTQNNILPIIMRDNYPVPQEYGEFTYEGNMDIFVKENEKSKRMYIRCETPVIVKNNVLGIFNLEGGKIYECYFTTVGMNPSLKRNNLWIAQRNLPNIITGTAQETFRKIAELI
jgi:hypothetical protein